MACFETLNLSLPAEDVRMLERLAEEKNTTMAAVVREALYCLNWQEHTQEHAQDQIAYAEKLVGEGR
jgi:hypothetical protein